MALKIVLISFCYTLVGILCTLFFQFVFDKFIPVKNIGLLHLFGTGFVLLNILQGAIQYFRIKLILLLEKKFDIELTFHSYTHIMELPMNFFALRQTGEIISRLNDASKIRDVLSGVTISAAVDTVMAVFCGIILFMYDKTLFFIAFITLVLYGTINLFFASKIRKKNREVLEQSANVNSMFIETIKGIETIKSYGAEKEVEKKSGNIFTKLLDASIDCQDNQGFLGAITAAICGIGYIAIIWAGAMKVMNRDITVGVLLTFYSLAGYFLSPGQRIMDLQIQLQGAIAAMQRLEQLLISEPEDKNVEKGTSDLGHIGQIKVSNLNFRYGTRNLVLNDVSFEINENEKIAFVGESGSGKTTIAKLLLGFYEYEAGDIFFGTKNLNEINKEWLRSNIAYVSQEPYFFKGTVRENLLFGNSSYHSETEIIKILEIVKIRDFIKESPDGIEMKLQEGAFNISGGQRQRLCLARALLRKPKILILDEATSNLDVITEKAITDALEEYTDTTKIIIAHRLSTVKNCDKIIVLKDGRILEEGRHEKLIKNKKYYYSLWKKQE